MAVGVASRLAATAARRRGAAGRRVRVAPAGPPLDHDHEGSRDPTGAKDVPRKAVRAHGDLLGGPRAGREPRARRGRAGRRERPAAGQAGPAPRGARRLGPAGSAARRVLVTRRRQPLRDAGAPPVRGERRTSHGARRGAPGAATQRAAAVRPHATRRAPRGLGRRDQAVPGALRPRPASHGSPRRGGPSLDVAHAGSPRPATAPMTTTDRRRPRRPRRCGCATSRRPVGAMRRRPLSRAPSCRASSSAVCVRQRPIRRPWPENGSSRACRPRSTRTTGGATRRPRGGSGLSCRRHPASRACERSRGSRATERAGGVPRSSTCGRTRR